MPGPERYARVKDVYLAASRLPKGDRTRYLTAQCEGEPGLADQVRALLTADEREPEFLESPALDNPDVEPGTRLGHFTVQRLLGEGGMGVVYEAQQDEPSRRVALKLIRPGFLTARLRARFRHEIRILGQLRHPGIAQIYEAGTLDLRGQDVPYFAMELVEGTPLLESARPLSVRERLALLAQICDAVHHAHQKGVIHRDLKPANILVEQAPTADSTASGTSLPFQIKVLDFGIARVTDTDIHTVSIHTDPGQLVGTIPYMSPEQVSGKPDAVDTRTDVYSLGVIAFELLGGRLPYPVRERLLPDAVRIVRETDPTRLGSIDRALRGDVETIIAKALEKDPAHRYQSAAEFAADIRRFLRDEPIIARPASALYQLRKFARRHKPVVAAAALVFAAMAAATIISTWQARVALHAKALAESERTRANLSAESARREARRATLAAAAAAIESGDPIAARRSLQGVAEPDRGWAWRYWNARLDDSIAVVELPSRAVAACLTGDDRVRVLGADGGISEGSLWDTGLTSGSIIAGAPFGGAAFTADGARLIVAGGAQRRSLDEFDTRDGSLIRHIADLPAAGTLVEVSNDGAVIVVALKRQTGAPIADDVWIWDHDSLGRSIRPVGRTSDLAITPDGRSVLFGRDSAELWKSGSAEPRSLATSPRGENHFAITPDGSRFAMGGEDKAIRIWDLAAPAEPLTSIRGHAGHITALAIDPTGAVLASAGSDLTIRLWDAHTGKPLATLMGGTSRIRDLRYGRDGARLMSIANDGTIRVWARDPYESASVLRGHSSYVYGVAFTPDSSRIASASWDESVRVWDAAGGRSLRVIPADGHGYITSLAVHPDGVGIITAHKESDWEGARAFLWNADSGSLMWSFRFGRGEAHDVVINRAGTRLWVGWEGGGAGFADLASHPPAMKPLASRFSTHSLALSADESRFALGGVGGMIRIADSTTGELVREWKGHGSVVTAVAWCPTRPILASASADATIRLWNADSGDLLAKLDRHWDKVYCLAFSPDGDNLASGSDDTTIRIWDTDSGDELTQLRGHTEYIYSLAFSPDGSRLASGSGDHTVRVWDTRPVHERWRAHAQSPSPR